MTLRFDGQVVAVSGAGHGLGCTPVPSAVGCSSVS